MTPNGLNAPPENLPLLPYPLQLLCPSLSLFAGTPELPWVLSHRGQILPGLPQGSWIALETHPEAPCYASHHSIYQWFVWIVS